VTDADFERATQPKSELMESIVQKTAQLTAQPAHAGSRNDSPGVLAPTKNAGKTAVSRRFVMQSVGDEGLEPPTSTV